MRGKNYRNVLKQLEPTKLYDPKDAVYLLKKITFAKFDEGIEVHFNLGIDPKQADQQIRGTLSLPHGTGKKIRLCVIAQGEKIIEAKEAGADIVGSEDVIEKILGGWIEFDLVIAAPDMMSKMGKLGKILGTKGLMPTPKNGTVTPELARTIKEFKAGKIEYRNDKAGIVHALIGKKSFSESSLAANFNALYDVIQKVKPSKAKGIYIKTISLCSTMSPGINIEPLKVKWKEGQS